MNLCHSIAVNERSVFVAQLRKLMLVIEMDEEEDSTQFKDQTTKNGHTALKEFTKHNFNVLVGISPPDDLKTIFRDSFGYAVKTQQYSIVSDLIKYSKEKFFPLWITEDIMDSLLIKRQFMLMQNLVKRAMIFRVLVQDGPKPVHNEKYL
jgi:hypothetical protein